MPYQTKDLRLEFKAVSDDGTFDGYLSVFDVVDLGNDLVEKGAFTKTLVEQNGVVPMLWAHDHKEPLGILALSEDDRGLPVHGEFFLDESAKAREVHAMAKRYHEKKRPMGLSIGYDVVKKSIEKGVRRLKELKLFEGSLTLFPMLPLAHITSIKGADSEKSDFLAELNRAQTMAMRHIMQDSIIYALDSIVWDSEMDRGAKVQAAAESIDQFRETYLAFLPGLFDAWGEKTGTDAKAGRRISAASRMMIEEAIQQLQALLAEEAASTSGALEAAGTSASEAATKSNEPDALHSLFTKYTERICSEIASA